MTSWTSATSAVTPNFTSWNRNVIQPRIPSDPTRISTRAWVMRSLDTTGPIVVSESCWAIGPNRASRAFATAPSLPSVGICVLPAAAALGDGDGAADAAGLAEGAGDGDGDAAGEADGATEADGFALPDAAAEPDAPAEPDGTAEPDAEGTGVSVGPGVGDGGGGTRPTGALVLISRKPFDVVTTV